MATPVDELGRLFGFAERPAMTMRWNVPPTTEIAVMRQATGAASSLSLTLMRWGLVPHWARDATLAASMINARAETVAEKPAFREAWRRRRCLILADGFYEWRRGPDRKQPFYIHPADGLPMAMAGLWESWGRPGEIPLLTACIITVAANAAMAPVHHRMPAILDGAAQRLWLAHDSTAETLQVLLAPAPEALLTLVPVSNAVNQVRNNGPDLIRPTAELQPVEPARQGLLL
jgi:putative SOS response-associated peptidase YedK